MKAHYRMPASKEIRQLSKKLLEEMAAERKKEQDQAISRTLKMVCVVLNQDFGFGEKRLEKFLDAVFDGGNEVVDRPEEWFHIDEKLSQIGIFLSLKILTNGSSTAVTCITIRAGNSECTKENKHDTIRNDKPGGGTV